MVVVGLSLLVALTSSAYFSSYAPDSTPGSAKESFYIRTGQWLADARTVVNDGARLTRQPVEESGLAHIGGPYDGHKRKLHKRFTFQIL